MSRITDLEKKIIFLNDMFESLQITVEENQARIEKILKTMEALSDGKDR